MNDYAIMTDSSCDISPEMLKDWGVGSASLTFHFDGSPQEYVNAEMPTQEFYKRMRSGEVARTSAANADSFHAVFEEKLQQGLDILYLGFSSGLSTTVNAGRLAAKELMEKYPERKIVTVDTLCASAGQGLMVYAALEKKKQGLSLEENARYVEENKLNLCHWFTVDDLVYLKRGGRISAAAAFAGSVLGIKPVMHVDNEGHLINMFKVRGRRQSIRAMADKYMELALDPKGGTVFISHGDCLEDAQYLDDLLNKAAGVRTKVITYVGPVIGAHSGPGTLALFFFGKQR